MDSVATSVCMRVCVCVCCINCPFFCQELTASLKRDHEAVNKDNNFIYNDRVPDFATLEPPGKATLAKAAKFSSPASNFQVKIRTHENTLSRPDNENLTQRKFPAIQ